MINPGLSGRWDRVRLRRAARDILAAGLEAADPARLVRRTGAGCLATG